jgi:hypothetical protein
MIAHLECQGEGRQLLCGVLVVRPVTAWDDANHFLHRTISVAFADQNVGGALFALLTAIGPTKYTGSGERTFNTVEMNRRFSVSLDATPALEALNVNQRVRWSLRL